MKIIQILNKNIFLCYFSFISYNGRCSIATISNGFLETISKIFIILTKSCNVHLKIQLTKSKSLDIKNVNDYLKMQK